jgi:hypothetical protein
LRKCAIVPGLIQSATPPVPAAPLLTVVDNQSGLLLAVDEKPRVIAAHLDPDRGPGVGLQVHVRLIPDGVSLRRRNQGQSGCDTYCAA